MACPVKLLNALIYRFNCIVGARVFVTACFIQRLQFVQESAAVPNHVHAIGPILPYLMFYHEMKCDSARLQHQSVAPHQVLEWKGWIAAFDYNVTFDTHARGSTALCVVP